jgi:flavin reductase (DIM6/NTAB) family NADH-FMN oxidoreductase RutF
MSSAFWLGWRCLLGFEGVSTTPQYLIRTGECVLNLPSVAQVDSVNRLAYLTGSDPVPAGKARRNYRFEQDKFGASGMTPVASESGAAARAMECPIQFEANPARVNPVVTDGYDYSVHEGSVECTLQGIACIEIRITRVHRS